jgi:hypothetical protein
MPYNDGKILTDDYAEVITNLITARQVAAYRSARFGLRAFDCQSEMSLALSRFYLGYNQTLTVPGVRQGRLPF